MKKIVLFLLLVSCSTKPLKDVAPAWIASPYSTCNENQELCASSSGTTIADADNAARAELASFFKVKISTQLESTQVLQINDLQENYYKKLGSTVSEVLQGSIIRERFIHHDKEYYSLAQMKKSLLEATLREELKKVDQKASDLLDENARLALFELKNLYAERTTYEQMLRLISTAAEKSGAAWWSEIQASRSPKLKFFLNAVTLADQDYTQALAGLISQVGHKQVTVKDQADIVVTVQTTIKEEFIRVQGFLKANVSLKVIAFNVKKGMEIAGSINEEEAVTARSREQLLVRATAEIRSRLEKKIYLLNF
jgi:hypothetical protein